MKRLASVARWVHADPERVVFIGVCVVLIILTFPGVLA